MKKNTVIVIPTFNEKENIVGLVEQVLAEGVERVIVVDDNSPDGTADEVKQRVFSKKVSMMQREGKGGRGSAVLAGFSQAFRDATIEYFVEMDADRSHDPTDLPRILKAMNKNDLVIASRYVAGSQIVNWPLSRRVFSKVANLMARTILGVKVRDCTNGYRCYTRKALQALDLNNLSEKGYALLMEMLYRAKQEKLRVMEIPVTFVNRVRGKSNTTLKEVWNAFMAPFRIRLLPSRKKH